MDHSETDDEQQSRLRQELTDFVSQTEWNGQGVLGYCRRCRLNELQNFVVALETGKGPIPLGFRWLHDDVDGSFELDDKPE